MENTYESWMTQFVENLASFFNLAGWTIKIKYNEEEETHNGCETYAEIEVNSPYLFATVIILPQGKKDFEAGNLDQLVMAVVHELVHIFLDPFQDQMHPHLSMTTTPAFMDILEQQTQKLTMVFLKSLPPDIVPPTGRNGIHDSIGTDDSDMSAVPAAGPSDVPDKSE